MIHKKRVITPCSIYILLWLLYNMQGILYPSGGVVSVSVLAILMVWGMYNMIQANRYIPIPKYFKGLNVLLLLFTVYGIYLMMLGQDIFITEGDVREVRKFGYLKEVYSSLLPAYSFYLFAKRQEFDSALFNKWFVAFIFVAVLQYVRALHMNMISVGNDEVTNNSGYLFVALMPGLLLFRAKPIWQYVCALAFLALIFFSMKRGAILIGVFAVAYFFYYKLNHSTGRKKAIVFFALSIFFVFSCFLVSQLLETSDYFNARLQATLEGNDSNRSEMYSHLWNVFLHESSMLQMLFGRGAWGTLTVNMNFAHNDWLEILINQGLLGIAVFLYYLWCFYKSGKDNRMSQDMQSCLFLAFLICLAKTFFSMSYSDMNIYLTSAVGLCLASRKSS